MARNKTDPFLEPCPLCGKYRSKWYMKIHIKLAHEEKEENNQRLHSASLNRLKTIRTPKQWWEA